MTPQTLPETIFNPDALLLIAAGLYHSESGRWDGAEVGWLLPTQDGWPVFIFRTTCWRQTTH